MDPAQDKVFLWWIIDQVKVLARDPQFQKDFEEWQRERAAKGTDCRDSLRTVSQ